MTSALALTLALTPICGPAYTAFAEETAEQPAEALESYEVDGITYYNVHSPNFDNPSYYLPDLLKNKGEAIGNRSMTDLWAMLVLGILDANDSSVDLSAYYPDIKEALESGKDEMQWYEDPEHPEKGYTEITVYDPVFAKSWRQAVEKSYGSDGILLFYPYPKNDDGVNVYDKPRDTVSFTMTLEHVGPDGVAYSSLLSVFFSDFQVVALLPDSSGTNYVSTTITDSKTSDKTYASNVKNMTLAQVTATQTVSTSYSDTVSSTVNHSSSYSFTEGFKLGAEFLFKKISPEISFSSTQAFSNGWSKSESTTKTGTVSDAVSVVLPPYTNVIMEQGTTTTEVETRYNCPIGLRYTVTIAGQLDKSDETKTNLPAYTFGPDARADLYKRAIMDGALDLEEDGDQLDNAVHWNEFPEGPASEALQTIATSVPMSPVGAMFNQKLDTTFTEVDSIAPLEPLAIVRIQPPNVSFIGGEEINYGSLNYLRANMEVGDSSFTNYLSLKGENAFGAEYYGFSGANGHWIVIHPDGTEWTEEDAPVVISKDAASGYTRYTAVNPGTCYLKYLINEDCYTTAKNLTAFTKNSELLTTAALEITVKAKETVEDNSPKGSVHLSGDFTGVVGADPQRLDKDGAINVSIRDLDDIEVDKPYVWQKQELDSRGISMNEQNEVSFTKPGTFHVRVLCDELDTKSDWYEITAHDYSYSADGPVLTVACSEGDVTETLTVTAPVKKAYGDGKNPKAKVLGSIPGVERPEIVYSRGDEILSEPPTDAGTYTASITLGDATAAVEYTIDPAETVINSMPTASGLVLGRSLEFSELSGGEASVPGSFEWTDKTVCPTLEDSDKTEFEVTFTPDSPNYEKKTFGVTVHVRASGTFITLPQAKTLIYNGEAQELVEPGTTTEHGKIVYGLDEDNESVPDMALFTEEVPKATAPGTYFVWYCNVDTDGNRVSDPYVVKSTIESSTLTLNVESAAKIYDGEPLKAGVRADSLPEGHSLRESKFSSITEPGETAADIESLKIINAEGNDVTAMFNVTVVPGKLVVLEEPIFTVAAKVKNIEEEAFAGDDLESVLIGENVASVGPKAFADNTNLKTLVVKGSSTEFDASALAGSDNVTIYAPAGSKAQSFAETAGVPFIPLW